MYEEGGMESEAAVARATGGWLSVGTAFRENGGDAGGGWGGGA